MATIKSYTSLEQSKKLTEILPIESADMKYPYFGNAEWGETPRFGEPLEYSGNKDKPCWSLAALLGVLPKIDNYRLEIRHIDNNYCCCYTERNNVGDLYWYYADNPVDACYEMIIKLHELNLL